MTKTQLEEQIARNSATWHKTSGQQEKDRLHEENRQLYSQLDGMTGASSSFSSGSGKWSSSPPGQGNYVAPTLPHAKDLTEEVSHRQARATAAATTRLKGAKAEGLAALEETEAAIAPTYRTAKNQLGVQHEVEKKNLSQQSALSGLNSGANSQAALAQSVAYQGGVAQLEAGEAHAISGVARERSALEREYALAVAQAESEGDFALANALYQEGVRLDGTGLDRARQQGAQNQAVYTLNRENARLETTRADKHAATLRAETRQNQLWARENEQTAHDRQRQETQDVLATQKSQASQLQQDYQNQFKAASTLAEYGNFEGYAQMGFTPGQIASMRSWWVFTQQQKYQ